jgi:hypothetical protein
MTIPIAALHESAFGKSGHRDGADECPLLGVKQTSQIRPVMSTFDPKRTCRGASKIICACIGTGKAEERSDREACVSARHEAGMKDKPSSGSRGVVLQLPRTFTSAENGEIAARLLARVRQLGDAVEGEAAN